MDNYIKNKILVESYEEDMDVLTVSIINDYKAGIILHYDMNLESVEQIMVETSYEDDIINKYDLLKILEKAKKFIKFEDKGYSYKDLLNTKNIGMSELDEEINQAIFCIVFYLDVTNMLNNSLFKKDYYSLTKELKDFYLYLLDLLSDKIDITDFF